MMRRTLVLTTLALLTAGCSQSLQGLIYSRGTTPGEFHYPHVQYGHIERISLLDANDKEISTVNEQKPASSSSIDADAPNKASDSQASTEEARSKPSSAIDAAELNRKSPSSGSASSSVADTSADNPASITDPVKITKQIRELGLYDFTCTEATSGNQCTYTPSDAVLVKNTSQTPPQKARIKVRMDSGEDYWFNQPIAADWIPQVADRVKVFFADEPAPGTPRALRIQYSVAVPEDTTKTPE